MKTEIQKHNIETRIFVIRGVQVILDRDIAELYGVATKALNQVIKRNAKRFPPDFAFKLSKIELVELVTNCDRLRSLKHSSSLPFVFTELGVTMIASVLNSDTAVRTSIEIVRVFIMLQKNNQNEGFLISRLSRAEELLVDHSIKIQFLSNFYNELAPKKHGVFFNDQIFDAYVFACNLIQKAKSSIVLIDNYVDESTLIQISKRNSSVTAHIYTEKITPQLRLDLAKHHAQYPHITVSIIKKVHDRFLIIDN